MGINKQRFKDRQAVHYLCILSVVLSNFKILQQGVKCSLSKLTGKAYSFSQSKNLYYSLELNEIFWNEDNS